MAERQPTRTLVRGLAILEVLAKAAEPLGTSEIARRVGLDKATTSRLLSTLAETGYAAQNREDLRYRLASKVLRLSEGFTAGQALRDVAMPTLERLRERTNETLHLGQMQNDKVVYVEKLDTRQSIRLASAVGQTMPLHSTGIGKAILAGHQSQSRQQLVGRLSLEAKQPNTIETVEALLADLEETSVRGYSIDDCENEENVTCVGAAITVDGRVLGAVSVAGPSFRMKPHLEEYGKLVAEAATDISRAEERQSGLDPSTWNSHSTVDNVMGSET